MGKLQKTRDWFEARRIRAFELQMKGWRQRQIAEALGVSEFAVSRWMRNVREHGPESLYGRPRVGAPSRLTTEQKKQIPRLLEQGAEFFGFLGDVWTCARVAKVIHRELGVKYHKAHVSRILKDLHFTPQKPIILAAQRDEQAIRAWKQKVWPDLKKS